MFDYMKFIGIEPLGKKREKYALFYDKSRPKNNVITISMKEINKLLKRMR